MSFARIRSNNYWKKILDTATKIRLDAAKTASKKVVNKTTEATGESIKKNKIVEKLVEPKPVHDVNSKNVKEIVTPPEKR